MKNGRRGPANPQTTMCNLCNTLFAVNNHKIIDVFYDEYTPRKCEDCKRPLTWHDRQEAPYADGRFLCAECRAEYMDLHHPDPFGKDDAVPAAVMCV